MSTDNEFESEEHERRDGDKRNQWLYFGPYLSDRAWGTVREDLSADGNAWDWFPYSHSIFRAYRWNEDGIGGISDINQRLCLAMAFWNGKDSHLKERYFGLTNDQGNHGEDVKEVYFYDDNTPTHSYMKMTYVYPHEKFPYEELIAKNADIKYGESQPEYELFDELKSCFQNNNLFSIEIEYAKIQWNDILCRLKVKNISKSNKAPIYVLPQLWFRNCWDYPTNGKYESRSRIKSEDGKTLKIDNFDQDVGPLYLYWKSDDDQPAQLLFTENETNMKLAFGIEPEEEQEASFYKDGINEAIVNGDSSKCSADSCGSKAAIVFKFDLDPGQTQTVQLRLSARYMTTPFINSDEWFEKRLNEANNFYNACHDALNDYSMHVQRASWSGLLWTKQFFNLNVRQWLDEDPNIYKLNPHQISRMNLRNEHWKHMDCHDVISMPDKWEYPWFAVWDLAFHTIPFCTIDPTFAKEQLLLFLDERYMHPNGQIPAYEWQFSDVNPPVHAWAVWRVFKIAQKQLPNQDHFVFLERAYHKLLLNFTWWINRKDIQGRNIFEGGFLGMDNIGVFDRSHPLPTGGSLEQADGTAWMAMYCLNMLVISLQLTAKSLSYEYMAIKFLDHFIIIAESMSHDKSGLWDKMDEFFFDMLRLPDGNRIPLKVRSFVGLIPLFATETLENEWLEIAVLFKQRLDHHRQNESVISNIASLSERGKEDRILISAIDRDHFEKIMKKVLDPDEFLSDYGVRTLSKFHQDNPYIFTVDGTDYVVKYEPGESQSVMFGGNSNWRGPIWFPVNYLLLESMQKYYSYYGTEYRLECPTGSGNLLSVGEIVEELCTRLSKIFDGNECDKLSSLLDPDEFGKCIMFYEYYNGDNGSGIGAAHQTGWTSLISQILHYEHTENRYRAKSIFVQPIKNI